MNASMFFLLAFIAVFGSVSSFRSLSFFGTDSLGTDITGDGFLDENTEFGEFGQTTGNEFVSYGAAFSNVETDFTSGSNSTSGLAFGTIQSNVGSNNTDDEVVLGSGFNTVLSTANETESTIEIDSSQFSSSNGPGSSNIDFLAEAETEFEDNNLAGFSIQGSDQQESDTNTTSTVIANGFGISREGLSNSGSTICVGSLC